MQSETHANNSSIDDSVETLFQRLEELSGKLHNGRVTPQQFIEYDQLQELFQNLAALHDRQYRKQLRVRVN
jgi:hypothetical protein